MSLEVGMVVHVYDCCIAVTSVNRQTNEGTFKFFKDFEDADDWIHEGSKAQMPEWHSKYCNACLKAVE